MTTSPEHHNGIGTGIAAQIKQEQVDAPALGLPRGTKQLPAEASGLQTKLAEVENVRKTAKDQLRILLVKRRKDGVAMEEVVQRHAKDRASAEGNLAQTDASIAQLQAKLASLEIEVQEAAAAVEAESQQQLQALAGLFSSTHVAKMRRLGKDRMAKMLDVEGE
ncbi:hypothetical protein LTR95_013508 [Oleoguttula sp. CCFEE 5521]